MASWIGKWLKNVKNMMMKLQTFNHWIFRFGVPLLLSRLTWTWNTYSNLKIEKRCIDTISYHIATAKSSTEKPTWKSWNPNVDCVLRFQCHHFPLQIDCLQCVLVHPTFRVSDLQVPFLGGVDHQDYPGWPHPWTCLDRHPNEGACLRLTDRSHPGAECLPFREAKNRKHLSDDFWTMSDYCLWNLASTCW